MQDYSLGLIEEQFNNYLQKALHSEVPFYSDIIKHLQENKGKQIRSKLSLLCAGLGGELNKRSYRAAMIVEMLHSASLLHDDVVDNSMERRGAQSINAKWGEKIAVLSGDIISLKALLLSLSNKDYDIFTIYGKAVETIVQGELLQLKTTAKINTKEAVYFKIIEAKTAAFFSAACEAGAVTTFNDEPEAKQLGLFGKYIGIAFQIKDDLFGFGENDVGKPNDNDFKEKKITLPLIYTLNRVSYIKQRKLKRIIKGKSINNEEIKLIVNEVVESGGLRYAEKCMNEYGQKALEILNTFPVSEIRNEIEKLVNYTMNRDF